MSSVPWSSVPLVDSAVGAAGAFWYAGTLLVACLKACKETGTCALCYTEFAIALLTGGMVAPILSPVLAPHLAFVGMHNAIPVTLGIGFFSIPARPLIQKAGEVFFNRWIDKPGKTGA